MTSPYTVRPELWAETPIIRGINPLTGLIEGDDSGYRNVQTLGENSSPLVIPNVLIRASYDGEDEFGILDPAIALAGGLPDGKFVVREQVARELEKADENLHQITGGEYRLCALDGFRSWKRQAAGFTRMLGIQMNRMGLTADNVDDRVVDFLRAGNAADGTFAWVNANTSARSYLLLAQELETDSTFMDQIREFASTLTSMTLPDAIQETLYTYITVSANSGIGRAANRGVPLVFEGNAHAGGGAVDVFLVNKHGMPVNIVPFDYPGCEAGMDWMEDDANYQQYLKRVQRTSCWGDTSSGWAIPRRPSPPASGGRSATPTGSATTSPWPAAGRTTAATTAARTGTLSPATKGTTPGPGTWRPARC